MCFEWFRKRRHPAKKYCDGAAFVFEIGICENWNRSSPDREWLFSGDFSRPVSLTMAASALRRELCVGPKNKSSVCQSMMKLWYCGKSVSGQNDHLRFWNHLWMQSVFSFHFSNFILVSNFCFHHSPFRIKIAQLFAMRENMLSNMRKIALGQCNLIEGPLFTEKTCTTFYRDVTIRHRSHMIEIREVVLHRTRGVIWPG